MTADGLDRRVARLAEEVADLEAAPDALVCVMGPAGISDDPRVPALLAVARAEGRSIVRPWSTTADGRLMDHSSDAYVRARNDRCDADATKEADLR